jgi:hypothetical protein
MTLLFDGIFVVVREIKLLTNNSQYKVFNNGGSNMSQSQTFQPNFTKNVT